MIPFPPKLTDLHSQITFKLLLNETINPLVWYLMVLGIFFEFSLSFVCMKVTCKCLSNRTIKLFVQSLMAFMYSQDIYLPPTIFILQSNQSLVQILQDKFSDFVLHQQCRIPDSFFLDICKKFFMASYNPSNKN